MSTSEPTPDAKPIHGQPAQAPAASAVGWDATHQATSSETPIGYAALLGELGITSYVPTRQSALGSKVTRGHRSEIDSLGRERVIFPANTAARSGSVIAHLTTALRYDGVDLEALRLVFDKIDVPELQRSIRENPIAAPARRAWFAFEWITGKTLDIAPVTRANTIPFLDPEVYVTCEQGRSSRHGIAINVLGVRGLCPTIRRTPDWEAAIATNPLEQRDRLATELDDATSERINSFLVTRESHSTYAIEGENASPKNDEVFYALLKQLTSSNQDPLTNATLHQLQGKLLEGSLGKQVGRYRSHQIWVGDRSGHFAVPTHIAPKADDVPGYMDHFCAVANHITDAAHHQQINPIAAAVVTSGLLAYIHPFDDGNGRVGRLLLQKPLTSINEGRRLYLPVSSAINRHREGYYEALDAWSKPLLKRIQFDQVNGGVHVTNDTAALYRYPDLSTYAAFIAKACGEAVTKDLVEERAILAQYDAAYPLLLAAGLTQKHAELFFRLTHANGWKLGKKKTRLFPEVNEAQLTSLQADLLRACGPSLGTPPAGTPPEV